ncbi:MAG: bifunctional metallophosphatase/5'-nucleotidase [bacterium]
MFRKINKIVVLGLLFPCSLFAGQLQTISIIHMNDLHANLIPHKEQIRQEGSADILVSERGGLARIAGLMDELIAQNPEASIVVNVGDTYHGGGEALFSNGNVIVDLVNLLPIDVAVPGNWDYAFGPTASNARFGNLLMPEVHRPAFPELAANATYRIPPNITSPPAQNFVQSLFEYTAGDPFLPGTLIIERAGIKIGFIGLTSDIVERMDVRLAFNIEFLEGEQAYLDLLTQKSAELRAAGANAVVVLSELGIHKDWQLAQSLDTNSVNIFLSAHTHELTEVPLVTSNGVYVVESGNDAWLGKMDISFDGSLAVAYDWEVHPVTTKTIEKPSVKAAVDAARVPFVSSDPNLSIPPLSPPGAPPGLVPSAFPLELHHNLDAVIGLTHSAFSRRNSLNGSFNQAFTDVLRSNRQTDVAMTPGFRFMATVIPTASDFSGAAEDYHWQDETGVLLDGQVKAGDAYRLFPAPFVLAEGQVSGQRLREVIEENLNYVYSNNAFEQSGGWTDGFSGLQIEVDLSQPNNQRIISLRDADTGNEIQDDDLLTVTGCNRPFETSAGTSLCSYDGFSNVVQLSAPDGADSYASVDFLIDALEQNLFLQADIVPRTTFNDISGQALWPQSLFYQPLTGVASSTEFIFTNSFE